MAGELELLVSTRNPGKLRELRALLGPLGVAPIPAAERGVPEVEETGETLVDNALLKAAAGFEATGLPSLADDTGLMVDALDGAPGVYSARFAGEDATYEDNWRLLLERLRGRPTGERGAAFVSALALVVPESMAVDVAAGAPYRRLDAPEVPGGAVCYVVEGRAEGRITEDPRGDGGFGYDPVFFHLELGKTFAEMSDDEKNGVSHRAVALAQLETLVGRLRGG